MTPLSLDELSACMRGAVDSLGAGFLSDGSNKVLRAWISRDEASLKTFHQHLLRLVFRLASVRLAVSRGLINAQAVVALLTDAPGRGDSAIWTSVRRLFEALWGGDASVVPRLGTTLFAPSFVPWLAEVELADAAARSALEPLGFFDDVAATRWLAVAGAELGAVHEALLEMAPRLDPRTLAFRTSPKQGHERRATGSYYSPHTLIEQVLDRALDPVIAEARRTSASAAEQRAALLALRVCDPSCGAGAFLLGAARRIARAVVAVDPSTSEREATREVVAGCVYGVDSSALAVELCKLTLWLEVKTPELPLSSFDARIVHGDSLLGATPALLTRPPLMRAGSRRKQQSEKGSERDGVAPRSRESADLWCAMFFLSEARRDALGLTQERVAGWLAQPSQMPAAVVEETRQIAVRGKFLHWHLTFPEVFCEAREGAVSSCREAGWWGGFDVVVGNPPWIAHAGRAAQPIAEDVRRFFCATSPAFAGFRSTHGLFVHRSATLVRPGGRLGLIVPTSIADLEGYRATRAAHDRSAQIIEPLRNFGDGAFEGVFQPCMALVSEARRAGRASDVYGAAWALERGELSSEEDALLARLAGLPKLPAALFGERGWQTTRESRLLLRVGGSPPEGAVFVREGSDVREMQLLAPRLWIEAEALSSGLRGAADFAQVRFLIRQTARFPIASMSDGGVFRNSLLAGFAYPAWPPHMTLCLLNSRLLRWYHYQSFRDARQGMPQVKIGHLRSLPAPISLEATARELLERLGLALIARNDGIRDEERMAMDALVAKAYGVSEQEQALLAAWSPPR